MGTLPQQMEDHMKRRDEERPGIPTGGVTRRQFLTTVGVGALVAAAPAALPAETVAHEALLSPEEMAKVTLTVNGRRHRLLVEPRWSLAYVIRDRLQLTGTKIGCERGECGACTVLINGVARYGCLTLAVEADGAE